MNLWILENKSRVLEPIPETSFYFSIVTSVSFMSDVYLFLIVCVNVRLVQCGYCHFMVLGKIYILEANVIKKKSGLQNALLWSMISRTHPFLWIDMHFYLKDRMNINVTRIKLKSVGRGDGNSRLFQGFRGHLVLSRVNLNTYFFYSLDIIGIFPLSTPNKIWPLGFKTYEKQDESTIYTNFRNTFTLFPSGCENIQTSVPRELWKRIWTRRRNPLLSLSSLDCLRAYMLSHFSSVWLFVTLWTAAHQASVSTGCSRQEYCCGLPGPPPGDLLDSCVSCTGRQALYHQHRLGSPTLSQFIGNLPMKKVSWIYCFPCCFPFIHFDILRLFKNSLIKNIHLEIIAPQPSLILRFCQRTLLPSHS